MKLFVYGTLLGHVYDFFLDGCVSNPRLGFVEGTMYQNSSYPAVLLPEDKKKNMQPQIVYGVVFDLSFKSETEKYVFFTSLDGYEGCNDNLSNSLYFRNEIDVQLVKDNVLDMENNELDKKVKAFIYHGNPDNIGIKRMIESTVGTTAINFRTLEPFLNKLK